jgi:hypothetical protein
MTADIEKIDRVSPGWTRSRRVDQVSLGQLPSGFLSPPEPVLDPGRSGPESTRRACLGFKTLLPIIKGVESGLVIIFFGLVKFSNTSYQIKKFYP